MSNQLPFRFSIQGLPEGEALTGSEAEERLFEKLEAAGGKCLESLWNLASLYSRSGHQDQAAGCMHRIIELTDDAERHGSCCLALGQLAEQRGDYADAVTQYREAFAMEPASRDTWYFIHNNLGYSLNQVSDHQAAMPYLRAALEIDPERPNAYKNLGLSLQALGDLEGAAEMFIAATQVDASDPRSLAHLESLVEEHPSLLVDVPDLPDRLAMCREAVEFVGSHQPDFDQHWKKWRKERTDG